MTSSYICDMDGVIYRGSKLISGAKEFVKKLRVGGHKFVFLTNNAERTPQELKSKLDDLGIEVPVANFFTAAQATASFLNSQKQNGSAYVIGGHGLIQALESVGYKISDQNPDYVVVGTSESYNYKKITKAVNLVLKGARLVGTSPDLTGPKELGVVPACGALIAPIQLATKTIPYFIGKPSALMMRMALKHLGAHSAETFMVGDRMDTDIVGGIEAGMQTILVLSGVTKKSDIRHYAYRAKYVFDHVGKIPVRI